MASSIIGAFVGIVLSMAFVIFIKRLLEELDRLDSAVTE